MSEALAHSSVQARPQGPRLTLVSAASPPAMYKLCTEARQRTSIDSPPSRILPCALAAAALHIAGFAALLLLASTVTPPTPPETGFAVIFEGGGTGGAAASDSSGTEMADAADPRSDPGAAAVLDVSSTTTDSAEEVAPPTEPIQAEDADAGPSPAQEPEPPPEKIEAPAPPNDPLPVASAPAPDAEIAVEAELEPMATPATPPEPTAEPEARPVFFPPTKPPMPDRPADPKPIAEPPPATNADAPQTRTESPLERGVPAPPARIEETVSDVGAAGDVLPSGPESEASMIGDAVLSQRDGSGTGGQGPATPPGWTLGSASNPAPIYPYTARVRGWQGRVVLLVLVATNGHVKSVEVAESSGRKTLDNAARDAVRAWVFEPGRQAGIVTEMTVRVPIEFRLTG